MQHYVVRLEHVEMVRHTAEIPQHHKAAAEPDHQNFVMLVTADQEVAADNAAAVQPHQAAEDRRHRADPQQAFLMDKVVDVAPEIRNVLVGSAPVLPAAMPMAPVHQASNVKQEQPPQIVINVRKQTATSPDAADRPVMPAVHLRAATASAVKAKQPQVVLRIVKHQRQQLQAARHVHRERLFVNRAIPMFAPMFLHRILAITK